MIKRYYKELKFEGEYLNGKREGEGKEYNLTSQIEFEGTYLKGEKWKGKLKKYNLAGELDFEIDYSKPHNYFLPKNLKNGLKIMLINYGKIPIGIFPILHFYFRFPFDISYLTL